MIKWFWKLFFKAKIYSFKQNDIMVIKHPTKISMEKLRNLYLQQRMFLNDLGLKEMGLMFLPDDFDVFFLNNQCTDKSNCANKEEQC